MTQADELVEVLAEEDPLNELLQGYPGYDHRLPDLDEAAGERLRERALGIAREVAAEPGDPVTRGVVIQQAEAVATRVEARLVEHTVANHDVAPVGVLLSTLPEVLPEAAEDYLARLAAVPVSLRRRRRSGIGMGWRRGGFRWGIWSGWGFGGSTAI